MAKAKARSRTGGAGRKNRSTKQKHRGPAKATSAKTAPKKSGVKKAAPKRTLAERVRQYFRDVRQELRKTVWPTRQQVITSSIVVVVVLVVFSAYIAVLDFAWLQIIEAITAQF